MLKVSFSGNYLQLENARIIYKGIIYTKDNKSFVIEDGYLELGVIDTMKDLFVNFIGAVVFSIFGYLYVINREKYKGLESIIPRVKRD